MTEKKNFVESSISFPFDKDCYFYQTVQFAIYPNPYSNAMKHKYGEMNLAKYQTNPEGQYLENKHYVFYTNFYIESLPQILCSIPSIYLVTNIQD